MDHAYVRGTHLFDIPASLDFLDVQRHIDLSILVRYHDDAQMICLPTFTVRVVVVSAKLEVDYVCRIPAFTTIEISWGWL